MLLREPNETGYDLTFRFLGIEVRTHPLFFIMPILFGQGFVSSFRDVNAGIAMLIVVAIFWLSIVVHELGHSLAFRRFGIHSRIVLYYLGGLAIPESKRGFGQRPAGGMTPQQGMFVSFA